MTVSQSLVVLLEPEPAISQALEVSLRDAGFQVLPTPDGEAALQLVEAGISQVDAVLAEVAMPGVGGREIATVLADYRPDVPVILITSRPAWAGEPSEQARQPGPAPVDVRNTSELLIALRATIERLARVREQVQRAQLATPSLLERSRRLRAEQSGMLAAVRTLAARRAPPTCPNCAGARVAPVLYGHERLNHRDELASGKVVLGGAQRGGGDPAWYCRDCDQRW